MRIGMGYDVHRLVPGRKLVIGGVEIPFRVGADGHSDADVLLHALCDALLGAMGSGDIGQHFPDTDPQYKDISSLRLLKKVKMMLESSGGRVVNLDSVVLLAEPKLSPYYRTMKEKIAGVLGIEQAQVNIKATTTEGTGAIGAGEAVAAYAVVLVETSG